MVGGGVKMIVVSYSPTECPFWVTSYERKCCFLAWNLGNTLEIKLIKLVTQAR